MEIGNKVFLMNLNCVSHKRAKTMAKNGRVGIKNRGPKIIDFSPLKCIPLYPYRKYRPKNNVKDTLISFLNESLYLNSAHNPAGMKITKNGK